MKIEKDEKVIVSACLAGINCNYKGSNSEKEKIIELIRKGQALLVCPEQLGGLTTPRNPSERRDDKVVSINGEDVTKQYNRGAQEVLDLCLKYNIKKAILKSKSPSCGKGKIYDGTFLSNLIDGDGVTAELLMKNGIEVISSDELENLNI